MEAGWIVIVVIFGIMSGGGLGLASYRWYKAKVGNKPDDSEGIMDNLIPWDNEPDPYSLI